MFSPDGVDMTIGAMLLVCSVSGALLGGVLMDYVFGDAPHAPRGNCLISSVHRRLRSALVQSSSRVAPHNRCHRHSDYPIRAELRGSVGSAECHGDRSVYASGGWLDVAAYA